jgi:hypothetical protein
MQKYTIEYNGMICKSPNKEIDFYYYRNCPEPILKWKALKWIKGKTQTSVGTVVYIEKIGDIEYNRQFVF